LVDSLLRAAGENASATAAPADPAGPEATGPGERAEHVEAGADAAGRRHDPFCAWCPLCRGAAMVRELSPQTLTQLAALATVVAELLADLAVARRTAAADAPADEDADEDAAEAGPATGRAAPEPPTADRHD
jgi:hypothetical protein